MTTMISAAPTPHVVIRRSSIHGRGLFANRTIRKGELIGCYDGPRTDRDGRYVLWIVEEDGETYGIKGENEFRFVNHASEPNARFEGESLYALRTIREGEEITAHYGEDWRDV